MEQPAVGVDAKGGDLSGQPDPDRLVPLRNLNAPFDFIARQRPESQVQGEPETGPFRLLALLDRLVGARPAPA